MQRCVDALENLRSTPEAVSGYSAALAALIAGVSSSSLGIPHNRGKVTYNAIFFHYFHSFYIILKQCVQIVFNTAEELLRSASQNNRLAVQRTQAGWLLIGAVMTLGVSVVSSLVPRMLLLWRNSFPRSAKELESEKARGDAFTWQVLSNDLNYAVMLCTENVTNKKILTEFLLPRLSSLFINIFFSQVALEGRAGALSSICSFLRHCPQLATTEDITKRLMGPLDAAITMLTRYFVNT